MVSDDVQAGMCVTSNSAEVLELEKDGTVSPISGYRIKLRRPDIRGVLRLGVNICRQYNAEVSRVSRDEPSGKGTQPRARRGFLVGEAMAGTNKCKQRHIALPHILSLCYDPPLHRGYLTFRQ